MKNIETTQDCKKLRLYLKFLTCDLITDTDSSTSSLACSLCTAVITDSTEHVLVSCRKLSEVRNRLFPELMNKVSQVQPMSGILSANVPPYILTQFILDCSSPNLPSNYRIPAHNPMISEIYRAARDWCFAIANERFRLLKQPRQCNWEQRRRFICSSDSITKVIRNCETNNWGEGTQMYNIYNPVINNVWRMLMKWE